VLRFTEHPEIRFKILNTKRTTTTSYALYLTFKTLQTLRNPTPRDIPGRDLRSAEDTRRNIFPESPRKQGRASAHTRKQCSAICTWDWKPWIVATTSNAQAHAILNPQCCRSAAAISVACTPQRSCSKTSHQKRSSWGLQPDEDTRRKTSC
jgi:hypothetical protein